MDINTCLTRANKYYNEGHNKQAAHGDRYFSLAPLSLINRQIAIARPKSAKALLVAEVRAVQPIENTHRHYAHISRHSAPVMQHQALQRLSKCFSLIMAKHCRLSKARIRRNRDRNHGFFSILPY